MTIKKRTIATLTTCSMLFFSPLLNAENIAYKHPPVPEFSKWNWRFDTEHLVVDDEVAAQKRVEDRALALSAGAEYALGGTPQIINFGFKFCSTVTKMTLSKRSRIALATLAPPTRTQALFCCTPTMV